MSNQDKLHIWWWGHSGPANTAPLTIGQINTELQSALSTGVVSGKHRKISTAGWNYAVFKFLIEKCTLPDPISAVLIKNANPKNGNYSVWRKHLNVQVSVNPLNAMKSNSIISCDSPTASNVADKKTLKELIMNLQNIIMHNGIVRRIPSTLWLAYRWLTIFFIGSQKAEPAEEYVNKSKGIWSTYDMQIISLRS